MQHVEFLDRDHFAQRYHRRKARGRLARFIDFFWETDFDGLWAQHPHGFSDALFANTGYTYLINLGTPFVMQLGTDSFELKADGFLPRHKPLVCHHAVGNRIFGIKFKVSPVLFQKRIDFSEYKEYIFPLAYLIERAVVERVKEAASFEKRVELISAYYGRIIEEHAGALAWVDIVTGILDHCSRAQAFDTPVEEWARRYGISSRTLQRYFEAATSVSSKQALQLLRIRQAAEALAADPRSFDHRRFGYYDYSHFHKHLKAFLGADRVSKFQWQRVDE